jgi:hypothetical protein
MGQRHPNFRRAQRRGGTFRHPHARRESFESQLVVGCLLVAVVTWNATPLITEFWTGTPPAASSPEESAARERSVHYSGCNEARAAGAAPIYRGEPGYRSEMDGDGDGIACEPPRW